MTRFTFFLAALLWVLPTPTSASNNFQPGYVILQNGERLEGFLEFKDREKSPSTAVFKTSLEGEAKVYHPLELQAFGVGKDRFVSAIVETENTSVRTHELTRDRDFIIETDTAFLRTIVDGTVGLYQFKNDKGIENFYIRDDKGYTLLLHKYFLVPNKDGTSQKGENNLYRSQLSDYLKGCNTSSELLKESQYTLGFLEGLFTSWYACTAKEMDFHREPDRLLFEFGALLGVSRTQLNITTSIPHLNNSVFEPSYNPTFGLYMDMILPRLQRRLSINSELLFSAYSTSADYTSDLTSLISRNYKPELAFAYFSLKNMLRYRWPLGSTTLFGNLGISNGFVVGSTNTKLVTSTSSTTVREETLPAVENQRNYEQGILVGLGLQYQRFSLEGRYQRGNGFSKAVSTGTTTHQINLLAGVRF